ncbi:hypothetical protein FGG08_004403 [Glutinoglossum americanum]|uniref:Uncharacterized protein n=1 Tax=Glutinoglossum americanum TaxID=1670608 RepID=A0A9P8L2S7_9PEZI|nr:hypothetical protein FGG08_004403 [Glutinoglossum americanum]
MATKETKDPLSTEARSPLCSYDELPEWLQINPLIRQGYRKNVHTLRACYGSLWYIHNETVNIWSHLFAGLVFAGLNVLGAEVLAPGLTIGLAGGMASMAWTDRLVLRMFLLGANLCLVFSAMFHLLHPHSPHVSQNTLHLDFLGIVLNILTTVISITHFLPLPSSYAVIYQCLCVSMALATYTVILHPSLRAAGRAAGLRACIFIAFAGSGVASLTHVWLVHGYKGLNAGIPFKEIVLESLLYLVGALIYAKRWPEGRLSGKFDIWVSHYLNPWPHHETLTDAKF